MANWKVQLKRTGMVRGKSMAQMASDQKPYKGERKGERKESAGYMSKEAADICLNCKKAECKGSEYCFRKRKKKQKEKEKE